MPADDPDANQRLVREHLVDRVGGGRLLHPHADRRRPRRLRRRLPARSLAPAARRPGHRPHPPGLGPDGHTASLFPGAAEPRRGRRPAGASPPTTRTARNPHPRLTITLPVIDPARLVVFTVSGSQKRAASPGCCGGRGPAGGPGARHRRCAGSSTRRPSPPGRPGGSDGRPVPRTRPHCSRAGRVLRRRTLTPPGPGVGRGAAGQPGHHGAPGHLLPQGLHPAHHAVPRPLRLLHLRQGAGPPRQPLPARATRCWPSPGPGRPAGCHEALFTLGERPELRYPSARPLAGRARLRLDGRLPGRPCARLVLDETGLLPHANAGALFEDELAALRPVAASQGMMLETLAEDLAAHRRAPDKTPERAAGHPRGGRRAGHPLHHRDPGRHRRDPGRTGSPPWRPSPTAHRRHGHVQEVIVQNFLPKPGTGMARVAPCPPEELRWSIAAARLVLPADVHVQAPAQPLRRPGAAARRRASTTGAGSRRSRPTTSTPSGPGRRSSACEAATEAAGYTLAPRLTIYPRYALDPERWLDPALRFAVLDASDAEGLARDDRLVLGRRGRAARRCSRPRRSAGCRWPCRRRRRAGRRGPGRGRARPGGRRGRDRDAVLGPGRGGAGGRRAWPTSCAPRPWATTVTFVVNRNINYTNVCTFKCRFCAFSKGPLSLNLRGDPYLLDLDEITRRVAEAEAEGATEVCLQGGIHPNFDGDYYLDVHQGGPGRLRAHPHPRLHRPRGDRGRPALARCRSPTTWCG